MLPEPSFTIGSFVFLIISAQGLFLAVLLAVYNRSNVVANRTMAIFVAAFSMILCYYVLYWTGYSCNFMWTKGWCSALPFLLGPLMYLYIIIIKNGELPTNYKKHFIPFAVHLTYMLPFIYWFTTGPEVIATSQEPMNLFLQDKIYRHLNFVITSFQVFNALQFLSMFIYAFLLLRLLIKQQKEKHGSEHQQMKYRWYVRNISFYVLFSLCFSSYWITLYFGISIDGLDYLVSGIMSLCIYLIGYGAFRQPLSLFEQKNAITRKKLPPADLILQSQKLTTYLETQKPWLDSELNLNKLSELLQMPVHELSFLINSTLHKNFSELVHDY
ncbi:MAG TPA: hypothetical protein PLU02_13590, partial [Chitinophagales bacterium]|nr:hypothetical protein [Chitinophagales bacterium]